MKRRLSPASPRRSIIAHQSRQIRQLRRELILARFEARVARDLCDALRRAAAL